MEADIITFLPIKAAILILFGFNGRPTNISSGSPSRIDSKAPEARHTKNGAFFRSVTVTQEIDLNRPHY